MNIDYLYRLTPRQFYNITKGFGKRNEDNLKQQLVLNRRLAFTFASPYIKDHSMTEEKFMPLYFEKQKSAQVNLEEMIAQVEENKLFWDRVDAMRKGKA